MDVRLAQVLKYVLVSKQVLSLLIIKLSNVGQDAKLVTWLGLINAHNAVLDIS